MVETHDFIWILICKMTILIAKIPRNDEMQLAVVEFQLQAWMFGAFRHAPYSMVWGSEATTFMTEKPSPETTHKAQPPLNLMCDMFYLAGDDCCSAPLWPSDWICTLWRVLQTVWSRYVKHIVSLKKKKKIWNSDKLDLFKNVEYRQLKDKLWAFESLQLLCNFKKREIIWKTKQCKK